MVIRRLCSHLGAGRVFSELSKILDEEDDLAFASTMVQVSRVWMGETKCEWIARDYATHER